MGTWDPLRQVVTRPPADVVPHRARSKTLASEHNLAQNLGLLSLGLLWGAVACYFGLLGFPGVVSGLLLRLMLFSSLLGRG